MDIGRAFSFVFDDEEWLTVLLIGGLLMVVPILGQILLVGFMIETARNVMAGSDRPLPKWNHLGETFSHGLAGFVIQLVYALPIILISGLFACLGLLLAISGADAPDSPAFASMIMLIFFCLTPLLILLGLLVQPLTLAALARHTQTGSLGSALRIGEVMGTLRSDMGGWLVLWLLQILCGFVAGLGGVFFVIGALVTTVYATAVFGHLLGQKLSGAPIQHA